MRFATLILNRRQHRAGVLLTAVAIDLLFGEPPACIHLVVWMGALIERLQRTVPAERRRTRPVREITIGAAITLTLLALATTAAAAVQRTTRHLPAPLALGIEGLLLKSLLSIRLLFLSVGRVRDELVRDDVEAARGAVNQLVSRDVKRLTPELIAAAAIETLAENLGDSIVGPVLFYLWLGLPGAAAYRAVNTLDAMLGYRDDREYLGKVPARVDDLTNLLPARITAAAIATSSALVGRNPLQVWRSAQRDARRTASPNAGWPMAVMAHAIRVCLEKPGTYRLAPQYREPARADIGRAMQIAAAALGELGVALVVLSIVSHLRRGRDR